MFIDMSLTKLRDIVKNGKTAEYNIKIGDQFFIDDKVIAAIIQIGNDDIICIVTNHFITCSYFLSPQINKEKKYTDVIGYPDSFLNKQVNKWFDKQSDEFKSVVKPTKINYETCLLSYIDSTLIQAANGITEVEEKVFVPSIKTLNSIINDSSTQDILPQSVIFDCSIWTSTPACDIIIHGENPPLFPWHDKWVFGAFYQSSCNKIHSRTGNNTGLSCLLFKIG